MEHLQKDPGTTKFNYNISQRNLYAQTRLPFSNPYLNRNLKDYKEKICARCDIKISSTFVALQNDAVGY